MRLLMFYVHEWWHRTASKGLAGAPDAEGEGSLKDAAVIFFHAEAGDEEKGAGVIQKFVKNAKWIAGKFGTKRVVLHSFNHLSSSKSSPEYAQAVLSEARERLERAGFAVMETPFGYFNEFRMHVAGDSLAKVYKEF
ncbi:MAG: hypothetical protein Kow0025_07560 [Thermodesulfovibrionales bacterium]